MGKFYAVSISIKGVLRFEADTIEQADKEVEDTLNEIRLIDGLTVTNTEYSLQEIKSK